MSDHDYSPETMAQNAGNNGDTPPNMPGDAPTTLPVESRERDDDFNFDASGNGGAGTSPDPAPEMPGDVPSNDRNYNNQNVPADPYVERLERLGGEPAPVITPEEFARLQRAGEVHIDERGRVRATRRPDAEAGVSLRKRRAWYGIVPDQYGRPAKKGNGD